MKNIQNEPVQSRVTQILKERGTTKAFIARKAGYKEDTFRKMLRGAYNMTVRDIIRIASALDVEVAALFETPEPACPERRVQ